MSLKTKSIRLLKLLKTELPFLQAPMYHYSRAQLVVQVSNASALGCLAQESTPHLKQSIDYIQTNTKKPFAVNLFLLPNIFAPSGLIVPVKNKLNAYREAMGLAIDTSTNASKPNVPSIDINEQIDIICEKKVPIVIFTFGIPDPSMVLKLKSNGTVLIGSVTTVHEALLYENAGMDAVIVQGSEAGGHRTSAILPEYGDIGLLSLISLVKEHVSIPIVAAGGIINARQIKAALEAGAEGVSMGTLFLTASECSTPAAHRDQIRNIKTTDKTVLTRIYTGRPARMLPNKFYREMSAIWKSNGGEDAIPFDFYARDIFGAAARKNDDKMFILWAG